MPIPLTDQDRPLPEHEKECHGLRIGVETPQGGVRRGVSPGGAAWEITMPCDYGFVHGTAGADGDSLDVFLGPDPLSESVWVLSQLTPDGTFDEYKVMLGFTSQSEAQLAYDMAHDSDWSWPNTMEEMDITGFTQRFVTGREGTEAPTDAAPTDPEGNADTPTIDTAKEGGTFLSKEYLAKVCPVDVASAHAQASALDADPACPDCGAELEWDDQGGDPDKAGKCNRCGGHHAPVSTNPVPAVTAGTVSGTDALPATPHADALPVTPAEDAAVLVVVTGDSSGAFTMQGITDTALLTAEQYHVVSADGHVLDAGKVGKPGENGPLRVSLLASLANKPNSNRRFFTPCFMRIVAPRADADAKATPMYGEEPHPPFDENRGQYVTDSTKEVWQSVAWHADSAGNLWTTVVIDEESPKGKRVGQKVRRREKLGVSVRWTPLPHLAKTARLADGLTVQYFDADVASAGFGIMALDYVPNPAFTQAGESAFDCEGHCDLGTLSAKTRLSDQSSGTDAPLALNTVCDVQNAATNPELGGGTNPALDASLSDSDLTQNTSDSTLTPATGTTPPSRKRKTAPMTPKEVREKLRKMLDAMPDSPEKSALKDDMEGMDDGDILNQIQAVNAMPAQPVAPTAATVRAEGESQMKELGDSLTALLKRTEDAQAKLDKALEDSAKLAAAKAVADQKAADKAAVASFADDLKANVADGYDLSRFTLPIFKEKIVNAALAAPTLDAAKKAVDSRIEDLDIHQALADAQGLGYKAPVAGVTIADDTRAATPRVEVVVDAGDNAIASVKAAMHAAFDADLRANHPEVTIDPKRRELNHKTFIAEIKERRGMNSREWQAALADSAQFLASDSKDKKIADPRRLQKVMADAGFIGTDERTRRALDSTNATTTASIYNQPLLGDVVLERLYQDPSALQHVSGWSPSNMAKVSTAFNGQVGADIRVMSKYRTAAAHDYRNDPAAGVVAENGSIPKVVLNTSFQDFSITTRNIGWEVSKMAEFQLAHGPMGFNLLAATMGDGLQEFSLMTENRVYLQMSMDSDNLFAAPIAGEVVAAGNYAFNAGGSVNQDAITYGPNVVAAVQIAPSSAATYGVNTLNTVCGGTNPYTTSANQSASTALRVPLCQPSTGFIINADGSRTTTTINAISVAVSLNNGVSAPLVQGWLDINKNVQSYVGSTANYAVDYANGKIVFNASAGLSAVGNIAAVPTAGKFAITLGYTYSYNADFMLVTYNGGYPNGQKQTDFYNTILQANDTLALRLNAPPNFARPDRLIGTQLSSIPIRNATLFYKLNSPEGTEYSQTTGDHYATRTHTHYYDTNADLPWGNNAYLFTRGGSTRYIVDTPLSVDGPFASYDANGNVIDSSQYRAREFSVFCTPLARDQAGNVFNRNARKLIFI